jgi:hypothetical protein
MAQGKVGLRKMIVQHCDGINPDDFIYKTSLKFGDEVGDAILKQVNTDRDYFQRRYKYNDGLDYNKTKELIRAIGLAKTKELQRRKNQIQDYFPDEKFISFKQYFCGEYYDKLIDDNLPEFLKQIAPGEPKPILQISDSDDGTGILPPHCGHQRISSLFCLLQGGGQETRWYRESTPFETIDPFHIPDLDKIELAVSVVLEPGVWYVFNHRAWHSVHKFAYQGPSRVNYGVDFDSISAPDLVDLIKEYERSLVR